MKTVLYTTKIYKQSMNNYKIKRGYLLRPPGDMKFHEWAKGESEIFFNTRREILYLQAAMKCSIIIIIIIIITGM